MHERRLWQFLEGTIVPCAEVLVAGVYVLDGDRDAAETTVARVREHAEPDDLEGPFSYRVFYNLACYEASIADAGDEWIGLEQALQQLRGALRRVHGRRRTELIGWARKDPSLRPLRLHEQYRTAFKALLTRYEAPKSRGRLRRANVPRKPHPKPD